MYICINFFKANETKEVDTTAQTVDYLNKLKDESLQTSEKFGNCCSK